MKNYFIAALAGLVVSCGQNSAETTELRPAPIVAPMTDIISVTRRGDSDGRTVVLIPGLASDAEVWTDTVAALNEFDVRIVQVAGFAGANPFAVDGNYTDTIAASINAHLSRSPGKEPVLVGHSMGGFVAIKAALTDKEGIDELIIVDSLPFLAEMFMPGTTPERAALSAPLIAAQMAAMPRTSFDSQQAANLPRLVKTKEYHTVLADWAKASDQFTVATIMGEMLAADLRPDLSDVTAEITVLAAYDKAMGMSASQVKDLYAAQYELAPKFKVRAVEDSFHFIMVDQKDAFLNILQEALTD